MTAQIAEVLILDGEKVALLSCPPLPTGHPQVIMGDPGDHPPGILGSTACWRRYQGTWEIRDGRLWLVGLEGLYRFQGEAPILADWFSGTLRVPRGAMLHYVHMGFESVYEQELLIAVEAGVVTGQTLIDNRAGPPEPPRPI